MDGSCGQKRDDNIGLYTAHSDPIVDRTIEKHLALIVAAVRAQLEPISIILYGSFGRGEGSVMVEGNQLIFLSDYELGVVTPSPIHRKLFRRLSQQLTAQLVVEAGVIWMRNGRVLKNRFNNLSYADGPPSTSTYELRHGSQSVYGRDMLALAPTIDPKQIPVESGVRLLINRMAEALWDCPEASLNGLDRLETVRRINKVMLACGEAILLVWGAYHYSYAERSRRFAALAPSLLPSAIPVATELPSLMKRATTFKLQPSLALYPEDDALLWSQAIAIVDATFRYLVKVDLGISFKSYADFPAQFLNHPKVRRGYSHYRFPPLPVPLDQKLINGIKYIRQGRSPPREFFIHPHITINRVVFAIIPVLFVNQPHQNKSTSEVLRKVRLCLELIGKLDDRAGDDNAEFKLLSERALRAWRHFCYD